MSDSLPAAARVSPSTGRNRDAIREVLKSRLPATGFVLEIAAGSGEHAIHNAAAFADLEWQPTDFDPEALASIAAWRDYAGLPNVLTPLRVNAADPDSWPVEGADVVVNINMIHISPWSATEGLLAGAGRRLPIGGLLFLYGPYFETGVETAPSNLAFDVDLRRRDPAWGVRLLEDVAAEAARHGLRLSERIAMPANNLALIFHKT